MVFDNANMCIVSKPYAAFDEVLRIATEMNLQHNHNQPELIY